MAFSLPEAKCLGEAAMKHHWRTSRRLMPHPDGLRRWDRAYQLLLEWASGVPASGRPPSEGAGDSKPEGEATDESRDLRARLDAAAGRGPDHRRADRAAARPRPDAGLGAARGEHLP